MSKYWKTFIVAVVLAGGVSTVAIADGYEPVGKGFAPPPAHIWTGFYAGVHAGGAWSADTSAALSGDPNVGQPCIDGVLNCFSQQLIPSSLDPDPSGFIGGVQFGHNWQKGKVVIGLEIDISYSDLDVGDSATLLFRGGPSDPFQTTLDTDIEWFSTLRGRVGFLPHDGWMIFATGGLAFGETKQSLTWANGTDTIFVFSDLICNPFTTCLAGSNSETSVGWTGGGGFEFAVSDKVTLNGEYLYVDLGSSTVTARPTPAATATGDPVFLRAKVENTLNVIRVGLNLKLY